MAYVERFNFKDVNSNLLTEEAEKEYLEYEKKHSMLQQQKHTIKIEKKSKKDDWEKRIEEFFKKGEELNAKVRNRYIKR